MVLGSWCLPPWWVLLTPKPSNWRCFHFTMRLLPCWNFTMVDLPLLLTPLACSTCAFQHNPCFWFILLPHWCFLCLVAADFLCILLSLLPAFLIDNLCELLAYHPTLPCINLCELLINPNNCRYHPDEIIDESWCPVGYVRPFILMSVI